MNHKQPGQTAYEAYCGKTNWTSLVSGLPLPQWSSVKPEIKESWAESERATLQTFAQEVKDRTENTQKWTGIKWQRAQSLAFLELLREKGLE